MGLESEGRVSTGLVSIGFVSAGRVSIGFESIGLVSVTSFDRVLLETGFVIVVDSFGFSEGDFNEPDVDEISVGLRIV